MDYALGTSLYKYQWDYIHNPQITFNWLHDEGEGEMMNFFNPYAKVGGIIDILEYLIDNQEAKDYFTPYFNGLVSPQDIWPLDAVNKLTAFFGNKIQIDAPGEAEIILKTLFEFWVMHDILEYQNGIINAVEFSEDDSKSDSDIINSFLLTQSIGLATNPYFLKRANEYYSSYSIAKIRKIEELTRVELRTSIYNIGSNRRFKNFMREVMQIPDGGQLNAIMELRRKGQRIDVIDEFCADLNEFHRFKNKLGRYISLSEMESTIEVQQKLITRSLRTNSFFNVALSGAEMFDFAFFFVKLYQDEVSPLYLAEELCTALVVSEIVAMLPASASSFVYGLATGGGAIAVAIIFAVFEYELNQHLESISVKYSDIVWWDYPDKDFDIVDWHKTSICKNQYGGGVLTLQYTEEQDVWNYSLPTSIRILDKDLAISIFGFEPKYVNYDFVEDGKYTPKYHVKYEPR
jgi:hypothetical protein